MDTGRIINLLLRTLMRRGVRQQLQQKVTGNSTDTKEDQIKARQVNQNLRRASQAVRMFRRIGKF